eukprot:5893924-Amphidinium_carterae.2
MVLFMDGGNRRIFVREGVTATCGLPLRCGHAACFSHQIAAVCWCFACRQVLVSLTSVNMRVNAFIDKT